MHVRLKHIKYMYSLIAFGERVTYCLVCVCVFACCIVCVCACVRVIPEPMHHTHMHKAVDLRIKAKKLLSRQRQSDYSTISVPQGFLVVSL